MSDVNPRVVYHLHSWMFFLTLFFFVLLFMSIDEVFGQEENEPEKVGIFEGMVESVRSWFEGVIDNRNIEEDPNNISNTTTDELHNTLNDTSGAIISAKEFFTKSHEAMTSLIENFAPPGFDPTWILLISIAVVIFIVWRLTGKIWEHMGLIILISGILILGFILLNINPTFD